MRKFRLALGIVILLCTGGTPHLFSTGMPLGEHLYISPPDALDDLISARLAGGLIMVRAQLNGIEGNYILDTGASHLFINQDLVTNKAVEAYGLGAQVAVEKGIVARFEIGQAVFENQALYKMDMRHLEAIKGCRIAGIIGTNLLKDFSLFVDYNKGLVRLEKSSTTSRDIPKKSLRDFPLTWQGHFPMLSVLVNEVEYAFAIDTGAEANIFSGNFEKALTAHTHDLKAGKVWSIAESSTAVRNFTLTEMECMGLNYTALGFMFSDLEALNDAYSVALDGILGYPFLRRHPFTLDFTAERLIIWEEGY